MTASVNRKLKHNDKVIIHKPDSPLNGRIATVIEGYFDTYFVKVEHLGMLHLDHYDERYLELIETTQKG